MRLLLDTHVFMWCDSEPDHLSEQARLLCADRTNDLILSVASVWEMQIKIQLGKLKLKLPLPDLIKKQQETNGLEILPIELRYIFALQNLPSYHKDPFDRLLIAQSLVEHLPILTADPAFSHYSVEIVW
ncbi:type II toxin-antitoxin system VapC family toxin [Deltaproteobacteria bacterium TL4]